MTLMRSAFKATAPIALLVAWGCAPAAAPVGAPSGGAVAAGAITPGVVEEGRQVFTSAGYCYVCHGANARGGSLGPDLTDDQWIWIQPGPNLHTELVTLIRTGVPQPRTYSAPMPPMGGATLTDQQLNAVAAYVGSL